MRNIRTTWLSVTNKVPSCIIRHVILAWESRRALHSLLAVTSRKRFMNLRRGQFIMATLNLNRRCNPFIRWKYLFYYAYSSNFHAYRNLSKQSLKKRIGPLQDRDDITIQITTSETKYLAFPNSQVVPLSVSHTSRVTKTTNICLKNAFTSTSGTRRPSWVFL